MKKHSMLLGAMALILSNVYGLVISTFFRPITPAILASSIFTIMLLLYVELNKRRLLIDARRRETHTLFVMLILTEMYFTFMAFTTLIYLNQFQQHGSSSLDMNSFIVGLHSLPISQTEELTLPYYFVSFLLFIYYLRCYYVMFWRQNIVFIFRYLKSYVTHLNRTLLSNLPKVRLTPEMKETPCPLCLEDYAEQEDITRLRCSHIFHLDCVKIWVAKSNCCPLCRNKVVHY